MHYRALISPPTKFAPIREWKRFLSSMEKEAKRDPQEGGYRNAIRMAEDHLAKMGQPV